MQYKDIDLVAQPAKLIRHGLDGLNDQMSIFTAHVNIYPSLTKQSDADAADINKILERYQRTGQLPDLIKAEPQYGDFSDVGSYQDAVQRVQLAHFQFDNLDAHIRKRFQNDPAQFLAFASNPNNASELVKLGLATSKAPVKPSTPSQPDSVSNSASGGLGQEGQN